MKQTVYAGTAISVVALLGLLLPSNVFATWTGTEGCTPGYWKNNADTNERAQALVGITVNDAVFDITGINLGDYQAFDGYENLETEDAVELQGGGVKAFYRHLGAAIFNIYYGVESISYIDPETDFKDIIQMAVDGDIEGAKNLLDDANNAGCSVDAFGNPKD